MSKEQNNEEINKPTMLVLQGGGSKGTGLPGHYKALKDIDVFNGIKEIYGTSVGSLAAAQMACGVDPQKFEDISTKTNLKGLLGKEGLWMFNKDGGPLYNLLKDTIKDSAKKYIQTNDIDRLCKERLSAISTIQATKDVQRNNLSKQIKANIGANAPLEETERMLDELNKLTYEKSKLDRMQDCLNKISSKDEAYKHLMRAANDKDTPMTFQDLGLLNALNPNDFKDLNVVVTRKDTGKVVYCSLENTPNLDISQACMASAAIPGVFKNRKIENIKCVDGGVVENIANVFEDRSEKKFEPDKKHTISPAEQNYLLLKNEFTKKQDINSNKKIDQKSEDQSLIELKTKTDIERTKKFNRVMIFAFGNNGVSDKALYSAKSPETINKQSWIEKIILKGVFRIMNIGNKGKRITGSDFHKSETQLLKILRDNAHNVIVHDPGKIKVDTLSFDNAQKHGRYLVLKAESDTKKYCANYGITKDLTDKDQVRDMFLEVYERAHSQGANKDRSQKLARICDLADKQYYKDFSTEELTQEFVNLALSNRSTKKLSTDTKTLEATIEILNKPDTPSSCRKAFIDALGMKLMPNESIHKFRFKKSDFERFAKSQNDLHNSHKQSNDKRKTITGECDAFLEEMRYVTPGMTPRNHNNDPVNLFQEYILNTAKTQNNSIHGSSSAKYSHDTKNLNLLIEKINDKSTSPVIRDIVRMAIGKHIMEKDAKFEANDFKNFLKSNDEKMNSMKKQQSTFVR